MECIVNIYREFTALKSITSKKKDVTHTLVHMKGNMKKNKNKKS